ncbi:MAG TPA: ParA family protein [Hyphomicrobiaceae bacterium]|nr:ParA family protein [Hyphomicrobiaceae bacterium]
MELAVGIIGIGTFAIVTVLMAIIRKYNAANDAAITAYKEALADKQKAEAKLDELNRTLGAVQYQLGMCQAAKTGDMSELGKRLKAALAENQQLQSRFALVRSMSNGGDAAFWSRRPQSNRRMPDYEVRLATMAKSAPIVLMAAQKGGVGKSTLTTNVAAAFVQMGKCVLAVDMDYQGTMSAQMAREGDLELGDDARVDQLLREEVHERWQTEILQVRQNLHFIPANYNLETVERREEYRWAIDETPDDVRYRLARALLSDYVQEKFDLVLIDAPPRMTLGFLNGFCASTHLFVPTVVDYASARAVGRFAQQFRRLVPTINPLLVFGGIIGTMTNAGPALPQVNAPVAKAAEEQAQAELGENRPLFLREAVMSRSAPLANSTDSGIGYWQVPATQPMFDDIAKAILKRIGRSET